MNLKELTDNYYYSLVRLRDGINDAITDSSVGVYTFNPIRGSIIAHISEMYGYLHYLEEQKENESK